MEKLDKKHRRQNSQRTYHNFRQLKQGTGSSFLGTDESYFCNNNLRQCIGNKILRLHMLQPDPILFEVVTILFATKSVT
ncbi:hypothetical protein Lal_00013603 [Lupinus albus]|nr:hypothetical protein Lal_00013603 [Lupinus albus]